MDRWSIRVIEEQNGNVEDLSISGEDYGKMPFNIINNYFSIGVVRMGSTLHYMALPMNVLCYVCAGAHKHGISYKLSSFYLLYI